MGFGCDNAPAPRFGLDLYHTAVYPQCASKEFLRSRSAAEVVVFDIPSGLTSLAAIYQI